MASRRRLAITTLTVGVVVASFFIGRASQHHGGVLDEARISIQSHDAAQTPTELLQQAAIEGMLRATGDRWSSYGATKSDNQNELEARYSGIGIWLTLGQAGGTEVSSVEKGSPAAIAGILPGDAITVVDGTDVSSLSVAVVADELRGAVDSVISMTVIRKGEPLDFKVARTEITTTNLDVSVLKDGILVIRIAAFERGVSNEIAKSLKKHPHKRGIILDLQGNPGGLVDEAVATVGLFVNGGRVVSYERAGDDPVSLDAPVGSKERAKIVVLVDAHSASAAEIVAAALQERNRAIIVGTKTFGKGSVQEPQTLSDGSIIQLTVGKYRTPSGRYIDGIGVSPDVVASTDILKRGAAVLRTLNTVAGSGVRG